MNNTHTSGLIKDNRKIFTGLNGSGIVGGLATLNSGNNYRSGLSTPTSTIMERGLRSHNNSLEESKLSESHANVTLGGPSTGNISLLNAGSGTGNQSISMSAHLGSPLKGNLMMNGGTSR